jgi:hypothetical protein
VLHLDGGRPRPLRRLLARQRNPKTNVWSLEPANDLHGFVADLARSGGSSACHQPASVVDPVRAVIDKQL